MQPREQQRWERELLLYMAVQGFMKPPLLKLFFLWHCARWHDRLVFCAALFKGGKAISFVRLCFLLGEVRAPGFFELHHWFNGDASVILS